ncbi:hypothetical protein [Parasitella parasitica]|uniref:Rho-GAP domain-containing protein n=1 Tax=Parasitella parasitica TaxID=35722 RepID=A0A0B7ND87_9FUNG|nr:hypothetical protein [Parasitella parasitica]
MMDFISCQQDYYQHVQFKCHSCRGTISSDDFSVIDGRKYHRGCLKCPGCAISDDTMPLQPSQPLMYSYNDRPYCRYHYSLIRGTACAGCGQTVYDQKEELENWHTECYMMKKYYHVQLADLQSPSDDHTSSRQLLERRQHQVEHLRFKIWNVVSQFEDESARMISNIAISYHPDQPEKTWQSLVTQIHALFSVVDLLFAHSAQQPSYTEYVESLTSCLLHLLESPHSATQNRVRMATQLSTNIRHLVRLGLQQAITLERNIRVDIIDDMLALLADKQCLKSLNLPCLNHHIQLLTMATARRLCPGKRPDETQLYKPTINQHERDSALSLENTSQPKMMSDHTLSRSKSNNAVNSTKTTISRMETFKRALTTSRRKNSPNACSGSTTTQALYISLPDVEQLNRYHTTPPLSPPTGSTVASDSNLYHHQISSATALPDLNLKQDCVIRHIAVLHVESHVEDAVLDDLLSMLSKKPSSAAASLWGKLKTHILTPTAEYPPSSPAASIAEKRIGVSLCNLSNGSLKSQASSPSSSGSFDRWKSHCPAVDACFSSNSLVPGFLQDCITALIDRGITTEGIFRKNGNIRGLKDMCDALDSQPNRQSWADLFRNQSSIQLAAFIKRFLRELPEPLLSWRLYKLFIMSSKATTLIGALNIIHYAVCILPKPNRDILLTLLALLHWVAQHSCSNKMDFENLARVMAPNILYASHEKKQQKTYDLMDISTCHGEIWVVSTMIQYYDRFFKVPNHFSMLLEDPKMTDYTGTHSIDLANPKHFANSFEGLLKIKKDAAISATHSLILPPSPSHSSSK